MMTCSIARRIVVGIVVVAAGRSIAAQQAKLPPVRSVEPAQALAVDPLIAAPVVSPENCLGRFFYSTGFVSEELDLLSGGRFVFVHGSCTGESRYVGAASWADGAVTLVSETMSDEREHGPPLPSDARFGPYLPVRWGERLYLLARDDRDGMARFCNAVNHGAEPRFRVMGHSFDALLREGDEQRAVAGRPEVPQEWLARILPEPIVAHVIAVRPDGSATLDVGSTDGVAPGMWLSLQFETVADWTVPQGQPWYSNALIVVEQVEADSCTTERRGRLPVVGQLVTGRIPLGDPPPRELWRAAGDAPELSFEPLPPLPGTSQADLDRWTESIRETFSPGIALEPELPARVVDQLTPAFFNALRGLSMINPFDVERARGILAVWKGYCSQCVGERVIQFDFETPGLIGSRQIAQRVWLIESFAMWWREMAADPKRLADFQRARQP